jgi:type II secretory pathway pseudopilin PulG
MNTKGSVLLDAVIAVALFGVLFTGFFALMQVGVKTITEHKARAGALAVARTQIEHIRSLDYTSVGLQSGTPSGSVAATATTTLNGIVYTTQNTIAWHDDAADGLAGADTNPQDYKDVRVEVSWPEHAGQSGSVVLSTFVADFEAE